MKVRFFPPQHQFLTSKTAVKFRSVPVSAEKQKLVFMQSDILVISVIENFDSGNKKRKLIFAGIGAAVFAVVIFVLTVWVFLSGAPQKNAEQERFVVALDSSNAEVVEKLKAGGFIKNVFAFDIALALKGSPKIKAGGYKISKSMNASEVASVFSSEPYMEWVVIPEGLRKEEIADILARALGWSESQKNQWITKDTAVKPEYFEGVYFPDTYLIPRGESSADTAKRLQAKFQEKFAPYLKEALKQNIKWDTVLKLASIVQREAAGKNDMPIVAGVLWNRLSQKINLGVDATLQYARGKTDGGWWVPIKISDKKMDSPYNTYTHSGLPPHPISNPGTDAIGAVLNPAKTDCLYYLHDSSGNIHCAKTYEEHQKNIEAYLK